MFLSHVYQSNYIINLIVYRKFGYDEISRFTSAKKMSTMIDSYGVL